MSDQVWRDLLTPMLAQAGIATSIRDVRALTGGVSSDIVEVVLDGGSSVCAKRALPTLKVASVWEAPVERNHFEIAWLKLAGSIVPGVAPRVLGEDQSNGVALLEYLPAAHYMLWKTELLQRRFALQTAPTVAAALASIHAATWNDAEVAAAFATDAMFDALRLDPYLRTLAQRTPDLAGPILAVLERTASTKLALVHGDVSPKNILISRQDGHPVLLDAECAWFGDPAFDAAFCLNHLLLKAIHVQPLASQLLDAAVTFHDIWIARLPQPARADATLRVAALLPCLMLGRIDGKSPVEYLEEPHRALVRTIARPLFQVAPSLVSAVVSATRTALEKQL